MTNKYSTFLDLIRVIAITLLLIGHIAQVFKHLYDFNLGYIAVTIFIILSGLTLQYQYGKKPFVYADFLKKRIQKIYPVYWTALLLSIFIFIGKIFATGTDKNLYNWQVFSFINIGCSISGTCAFVGKTGGPFLGTGWFIGVIMSLYLLFPTISRSIKKHAYLTLLATFLISLMTQLILIYVPVMPSEIQGWSWHWVPSSVLFEFTLGIFLANQIKIKYWLILNHYQKLSLVLAYFSKISFPLFLIHFPLQFLVIYLQNFGLNAGEAIFFFLIISITLSHLILIMADGLRFLFAKFIDLAHQFGWVTNH